MPGAIPRGCAFDVCRLVMLAAAGAVRRVAEVDPHVRIGLRLPLHEAITGFVPGQDLLDLVVENELAAVGLDREHRVAFVLAVAHDGEEERLPRPAGADQHAALEQRIVLAVAVAVIGIRPLLDRAPMIEVGHRLDDAVDVAIDGDEIVEGGRGQDDVARRRWDCGAFAGVRRAEFDPADRSARFGRDVDVADHVAAAHRGSRRQGRDCRERKRERRRDAAISVTHARSLRKAADLR